MLLRISRSSGLDALIDLVNGRIAGAQLNHLGAGRGNVTAIGGAARRQQLGVHASDLADSFYCGINQWTFRGQERLAKQCPVQIIFQVMALQDRIGAFPELLIGLLGGKPEVKTSHPAHRESHCLLRYPHEYWRSGSWWLERNRYPSSQTVSASSVSAGVARWTGLSARMGIGDMALMTFNSKLGGQ